ncbi:uncharacterized protein LOC133172049 [Saccostrea echinata]|uniref:uncharacterized protein LOC133172049 n=1 Tax=Saccostrea echinata TaxID=191078 RepID=UPI002A806E81|nr:uncharacterized protein LOC133172049 [Saccostrea echinata]
MADTIYQKKVIFSSKYRKKEVIVKLRKPTVPQWTILQITDKRTQSLVLYLFLDDGRETSKDLVLTLPLHAKLSQDVHNYTCEPLFQDGRDGKKIIEIVKQISNVGTFSVDVDHKPPSSYTVMDLHLPDFRTGSSTNEPAVSPLITSSNHKGYPVITDSFNLIFLKDIETGGILLYTTQVSQFTFPFQLRPVCDYELMSLRGCRLQTHCYLIAAVALCSFRTFRYFKEYM